MSKLLWELQEDFIDRRNKVVDILKDNSETITVKKLLDFGFNNNYISYRGETYCLGYKDKNGEYWDNDLDGIKDIMNMKIKFKYYDYDEDGFIIAYVKCAEEE